MKTVVALPQPNYGRNMFILFGSLFVFAAGLVAYLKSKKDLSLIITEIIYEIKYNALGAKALIDDLIEAKRNKIDLPKKSGKVAIVTGGSRGIGSEIVKMLLQCDMEVIIACRTPAAGDRLIRLLRDSGVTEGTGKVYELDNNSLESVRRFAESIKRNYSKIDVLVNNAGIMFTPYTETTDGFEQQWGINYLSHFLLTSLILPLLQAAGSARESARIVNVSSCAHHVGIINFDDINYKSGFITSAAYAQSKLAQIMFTKSVQDLLINRRYPVQAFAVHPGIVNTDLFNNTYLKKHAGWIINKFFKNPSQGATPIVYAAISRTIEGKGGMYISNCGPSSVNKAAENTEIRQRLFNLSLEQTELKDFI
ncbi:dehydrogenase/reductase SDR family member on chromosome X-like [Athalia rosae]|uniref:dehydrogenase/reductase SDR family member on chromosome X-like n=1 Tax=Athalia rosae TaxID=37344 RepID=UPI002033C5FE|nr:dehydrogenase/reductase SDR family member on chromosome X-like [Athalia rosae]XP_020708438.2 dehydrogenase/reductase SDR family member on chromosome X-like [Athalia rosae]